MIPDFSAPAFFEPFRTLTLHERTANLTAVAAMQRGLSVTFYRSQAEAGSSVPFMAPETTVPSFFSVADDRKRHMFDGAVIDTAKVAAGVATKDKVKTKQLLHARNLNTPVGGLVSSKNPRLLHELVRAGVKRFVIKAIDGSRGKGIYPGQTAAQVEQYLKLNPGKQILLEQHVAGHEIRIYVVAGKAVDAYHYIPAHVRGNGKDTVRTLFQARDALRARSPFLANATPDLADMEMALLMHKLTWDSVPADKQLVWLSPTSVPDNQGDFTPCLDRLPASMLQLAIDAAHVVGSNNCALDMILTPQGQAFVLEINIRAMFAALCFPHPTGDYNLTVPEAILDTVFPRARPMRRLTGFDFTTLRADLFDPARTTRGVDAAAYATFG